MSRVDLFLAKALGKDFMESLQKFELWKPGTRSVIDHEELRTALQIVPRTVIALLIKELTPMKIGDTKEVHLPVADNAMLRATKHERDVYSGEIEENNKKIVDFKLRALPGVGLVIMSAFELYDMDNLINSENEPEPVSEDSLADDAESKIQKLIDERLALHDLVGQVVDKKIAQKDAIQKLLLSKLSEELARKKVEVRAAKLVASKAAELERLKSASLPAAPIELPTKAEEAKRKRPLQEFLEGRRKSKEFSVHMAKSETENFECPDCRGKIFDKGIYSGCICYGDNGKVFIKKSESGIKLRFGRSWDEENIEMLLEVLQKKNR